jgi:hypothetical protein
MWEGSLLEVKTKAGAPHLAFEMWASAESMVKRCGIPHLKGEMWGTQDLSAMLKNFEKERSSPAGTADLSPARSAGLSKPRGAVP